MAERKHTPGPWEVAGHYVRTWRGNSAGIEVARVDFTDSFTDKPTREANLQLLAAAPALASALEDLRTRDACWCPPGLFHGRAPADDEHTNQCCAARAALRAAGRLP